MIVKQGKTNIKYLLIVVILTAIVGGGILVYQYSLVECNFSADCEGKPHITCAGEWGCIDNQCAWNCQVEEKQGVEEKKFGIFGDSEFDAVVSGYLEIQEKESFEGSKITTTYFVITKFYDDEFRKSIDEGINRGNSVNLKENGLYKFNLGCFEEGEIIGIEYEEDKIYIDEETTEKIINSSKENLISIILSFGKHFGFGCTCCNLAHQVRIYDEED